MSEKETFVKNQDRLTKTASDYNRYVDSLEQQRNNLLDAVVCFREALEKLARLGNEPDYGNSDGNIIAQQALKFKYKGD